MTALGSIDDMMASVTKHVQAVGINVGDMEADHVCFRTATIEEYVSTKATLEKEGATQLVESMIGGRSLIFGPPTLFFSPVSPAPAALSGQSRPSSFRFRCPGMEDKCAASKSRAPSQVVATRAAGSMSNSLSARNLSLWRLSKRLTPRSILT